jgi:nucleoside-diphosphate-sugar epimerase
MDKNAKIYIAGHRGLAGSAIQRAGYTNTVAKVGGYRGGFVQDITKPDGTMRKIMDVSRIKALGWKLTIDLEAGIALSCQDYLESLSL